MAIDRFSAESLFLLPEMGLPLERILMLGRQHLFLSATDCKYLEKHYPESKPVLESVHIDEETFAEPLLRSMGATQIDSMDFSAYQGSTLQHDLNRPIEATFHQRYDVVFDGGTLEHIFHFPVAIANAMNLVAQGGCLISCTPTNNYNGHGFYQFSPELFFRLFSSANGFRIRLIALVESTGSRSIFRPEDPKHLRHRLTFGGRGPLLMLVVAERSEIRKVLDEAPQQSDYETSWKEEKEGSSQPAIKSRRLSILRRSLKCVTPRVIVDYFHRRELANRIHKHSREGWKRVSNLRDCLVFP